jgi:hypothetical protein
MALFTSMPVKRHDPRRAEAAGTAVNTHGNPDNDERARRHAGPRLRVLACDAVAVRGGVRTLDGRDGGDGHPQPVRTKGRDRGLNVARSDGGTRTTLRAETRPTRFVPPRSVHARASGTSHMS